MTTKVPQNFASNTAYNFLCQRCQCLAVSTEMKINWNGLFVCARCWMPYPNAFLPEIVYNDPQPWPVVLPHDKQTNSITFQEGITPFNATAAEKVW